MESKQHISETTRWKIVATKEHFDKVKKEEWFWALVALSRAVNALRFVQMPLIDHENDTSPAGMRAKFNSLLFATALFVESNWLVQKLNKYFWKQKEFQDLANTTNKNKEAMALLDSGFTDLRNTAVSHFALDEIGKQLKDLELNEPIFVQAMGSTNAQVYYELADLCALRTFAGTLPQDEKQALDVLGERMKATADFINEFATAAETFLVSVLESEGWKAEIIPEPAPVQT